VEDSADVEELGVKVEPAAFVVEGGEEEDAKGMVVDEFGSVFQ